MIAYFPFRRIIPVRSVGNIQAAVGVSVITATISFRAYTVAVPSCSGGLPNALRAFKAEGNLRKPFSGGFQEKFCRTRKLDE
jgi:hypothetical protein